MLSQMERLPSFYGWIIFYCTYTTISLSTHPLIDLFCFHILAIINNATVKMGVHIYLFELVFLFSSDKYPEVELLDPTVVLFLIFWGHSILFSTLVPPTYVPTSSVWEVPFLHILANTCYFLSFWYLTFTQVWGDISVWFSFSFPWWLMTLHIFSCICWPSTCLLWNMSIQICPLFIRLLFWY